MKVRKAVIPAAGLGTRMLPVTKTVPKEMLPMVDRPVMQYIVEEAVSAGIEDILIITNRGKDVMEDYFDYAPELQTSPLFIKIRPRTARRLYLVCRKHLAEEVDFWQPDQQYAAEYVAGDQFAQPHRQRVERECRRECRAETCTIPPQESANHQSIGKYRRKRCKPFPFCGELCSDAGGQQRSQGSADDIRRAVRTQQVCDQTPNKKPPLGFRKKEWEHAQRFGYPALDRAVGDTKDRSGEGQDCIECADDGGQRQLADRVMFHVFDVPSIFCLENGPLLLGNRSGSNERRCRPAYRRPEGRLDRVWKPVVPILSQRLQKIYLLLPVLVLKI